MELPQEALVPVTWDDVQTLCQLYCTSPEANGGGQRTKLGDRTLAFIFRSASRLPQSGYHPAKRVVEHLQATLAPETIHEQMMHAVSISID